MMYYDVQLLPLEDGGVTIDPAPTPDGARHMPTIRVWVYSMAEERESTALSPANCNPQIARTTCHQVLRPQDVPMNR
jgi:hypothetical protein